MEKMHWRDQLSLLLYVVAFIFWVITMYDLVRHPELEPLINGGPKGFWDGAAYIISKLWSVSVYFRVWLLSALGASVALWVYGGFLAIISFVGSFFLPAMVSNPSPYYIGYEELVGISITVWMAVVLFSVCVFVISMISFFIKEISRDIRKKVISHET